MGDKVNQKSCHLLDPFEPVPSLRFPSMMRLFISFQGQSREEIMSLFGVCVCVGVGESYSGGRGGGGG